MWWGRKGRRVTAASPSVEEVVQTWRWAVRKGESLGVRQNGRNEWAGSRKRFLVTGCEWRFGCHRWG